MDRMLRKLAPVLYSIEFLVALVAVFEVWAQVGGQYHLDIMDWYWKAGLGTGLAAAVVMTTRGAVQGSRGWNRKSVAWLLIALALMAAIGAVTYHYHLNEVDEEQPEESYTRLETFERVA